MFQSSVGCLSHWRGPQFGLATENWQVNQPERRALLAIARTTTCLLLLLLSVPVWNGVVQPDTVPDRKSQRGNPRFQRANFGRSPRKCIATR